MSNDPFDLWAKENVAPNEIKAPDHTLVERVAIVMAVGNNGGSWNISYTEQQRGVWRKRAEEVVKMIKAELVK
jgi:hypothetical protein